MPSSGQSVPSAQSASRMAGLGTLLLSLWRHLSARRRRQFAWLLGLVLLSTFAEIASLGAVLPFLATLAAPESLLGYPLAAKLVAALGIASADALVLTLALTFAVVALLAGVIRILLLWASTRLAFATGADLSSEVYRRTLLQPYRVHISRSSSEVISGITKKVDGVVFYVLVPVLTLLSSGVQLVAITAVLLVIDPVVAMLAILSFGGTYAVLAWTSRRRLRRCSERIAHEQTQVIRALQEGLGGIRDVLLDGTQATYCDVYRQADRPLRQAQSFVVFNSGSPRFAMESLGLVLIAVLAYGMSRQPGGLSAALPMLGALAIAAQRVLPALQQSYGAWANIVASHASLADTLDLLDQPVESDAYETVVAAGPFEQIRFDNVTFRYSDDGPWVLDGVNLAIRRGKRIGVVGTTGSGKSTLLDVLMGLIEPTGGELLVDGRPMRGKPLKAWQRTIAHVPQAVFLADASIAQNIALGVPADQIDMARVEQAARQAQLADFISSRSGGYGAQVGERGVSLSGGQRQRVGIARALYKQASVLVFDEATSALDNETERSVMDAIEGLSRELTIVMIAHRLTTVQRCDLILELDGGRIVQQGSYGELLERSPSFRWQAQPHPLG
jgi:ATP-binding cassette, subfamily B, bacterial PglK